MPLETFLNYGSSILDAIEAAFPEFIEENEDDYKNISNNFSVALYDDWGGRGVYLSLFDEGRSYKFALDLSLVVQNENGFTWFLARPDNEKTRNRLDDLLDYQNPLPEWYRNAVRKNKDVIGAAHKTVWRQGYCLCENATWDELTNKIINVIIKVAQEHGCNIEDSFEARVSHSLAGSREARLERLKNANPIPTTRKPTSPIFNRNPDVVAEALYLAKGICQDCKQDAPFLKASDGTLYLEVHHKIPLAKGGEDTVENAIALCPNCHRKRHYG